MTKTRTLPQTFALSITALGGPARVARELGQAFQTVRQWHRRDSIPARHWAAVAELARRRGVVGITLTRFAEYQAQYKLRRGNEGTRRPVNNGGNHDIKTVAAP